MREACTGGVYHVGRGRSEGGVGGSYKLQSARKCYGPRSHLLPH